MWVGRHVKRRILQPGPAGASEGEAVGICGRDDGGSAWRIRYRVGVGGWSFDAWDETFYPPGLSKAKQLRHMSRTLTAIEVNATYYSSFKPETFAKWRDETPDGFVFSLKAHRFSTVRKTKEDMAKSTGAVSRPGDHAAQGQAGADQLAVSGHAEVRCGLFRDVPVGAAEGEGRAEAASCAGGAGDGV